MSDSQFRVAIKLGNAAMLAPYDVAEALQELSTKIKDFDRRPGVTYSGKIRDRNGNTVGYYAMTLPDNEEEEE